MEFQVERGTKKNSKWFSRSCIQPSHVCHWNNVLSCTVFMFKKYYSLRPSQTCTPESPYTVNREIFVVKIFSYGCWHTKIKHTKNFQQRIFTTRLFFYRLREGTRTSSEPSLQVSSRLRLPCSLLYFPP